MPLTALIQAVNGVYFDSVNGNGEKNPSYR
jgi:hypothetical protein